MNNYRPVSNRYFMSKLIERVNQLNEYLSANDLFSVSIQEGPFDRNRSAPSLVGHADGGRRATGHTTQSA